MSLYIEANQILLKKDGSLKSRIYNANHGTYKSPPKKLYALIIETLKHQDILNEVIQMSGILEIEKKLTHSLTLLLLHDHLLTKSGIATSIGPLKSTVIKHKARLSAEFTKALIHRGYGSTIKYIATLESAWNQQKLPRWVRVNLLKTSVDEVLNSFKNYAIVPNLSQVFEGNDAIYIDVFIPSLIAFPPTIDLLQHPLYVSGALVIQDRSSCFPAWLLSPPENSFVIDGTAAPGNKTTHLAAIVGRKTSGKIFAFEKDLQRAKILKTMVGKAGGTDLIEIRAGADFLKYDPREPDLADVTHILLDPSCSGSGIVGREEYTLRPFCTNLKPNKGKKRKRGGNLNPTPMAIKTNDYEVEQEKQSIDADEKRLSSLADFQKKIIQHAMKYISARKITYSTCSIHHEENEDVVTAVLDSDVAKRRGWNVERREDGTLKEWPRRGLREFCGSDKVAQACIRCNPIEDGGIGFFVVAFVRDGTEDRGLYFNSPDEVPKISSLEDMEGGEEEWTGFSDGEAGPNYLPPNESFHKRALSETQLN